MEKNVTFSFDKSSEAEEMTNQNFTFHIDVPISDNEVVRCVASTRIYYIYIMSDQIEFWYGYRLPYFSVKILQRCTISCPDWFNVWISYTGWISRCSPMNQLNVMVVSMFSVLCCLPRVLSRAANEGSRRFHNYFEGPEDSILIVSSMWKR